MTKTTMITSSKVLLVGLLLLPGTALASPSAKITICHIPPGNPGNTHTITISENALAAHQEHGDYLGECQPTPSPSPTPSPTVVPTETGTPVPSASPKPSPCAAPTDDPKETGGSKLPVTGIVSFAALGLTLLAAAAGVSLFARKAL